MVMFAFACCLRADGVVVRTLAGKALEGEVKFEKDGEISFIPRGGTPMPIAFGDILTANFGETLTEERPAVPERWQGRDVGQPALQGGSALAGNTLTVRAAGADMVGAKDECYYVYQPLAGDGQIVARIANIQQTDRFAKAGLMFRATIDQASPYAMILMHAGEGPSFQYRSRQGSSAHERRVGAPAAPLWLKLTRSKNEFSGYISSDGHNWDLLDTQTVALPPMAQVGVAVCSRNAHAICTATFERLTLTRGAVTGIATGAKPFKGVVLRSGSMLSGDLQLVNTSVVRLWRTREQSVSIPVADVAWVVVDGLNSTHAARLRGAKSGILLKTGDFIEGEVGGVTDGRVKISSVLFGARRYETWRIVAIVFRDPAAPAGNYAVRAGDGSMLYAEEMQIANSLLVIDTRIAGKVRFAPTDLLQIRAGPSRYKSLADLKPAVVRAGPLTPAFSVDANPGGGVLALRAVTCERGIVISAGSAVTYELGRGFRILNARFGVPDRALPAVPVRLFITGDDRELYRSPPRTSLDDAVLISLNVSGVEKLTLRLESTAERGVAPSALLADPALVR